MFQILLQTELTDDTLNCITFPLHFSYIIISLEIPRPSLTACNTFQNSFSKPSISSTASHSPQRLKFPQHSRSLRQGQERSFTSMQSFFLCVSAPQFSQAPFRYRVATAFWEETQQPLLGTLWQRHRTAPSNNLVFSTLGRYPCLPQSPHACFDYHQTPPFTC